MKKKYKQMVFVNFANCEPFIYKMVSNEPIKMSKVIKHFKETEAFSEYHDSITFVSDEVTTINLK